MSDQHEWNIGRYEIVDELGRGSMGVVHLAHDPLMQREVALKTIYLPRGLSAERRDEFQERFLREARAAGCLSHPGIVTVYDVDEGSDDNLPFIAMEYVAGRTLHELLVSRGRLQPDRALAIGETLAEALHMAHQAGIVHRDLKPANILVRETDGAAKVADFGVARISTSELTNADTTVGSPAYMAPERIQGHGTDARSDLFSLAVILYEALCGQHPFGGDDPASICYSIIHDAFVPPTERVEDLCPVSDRFFEYALAKDPEERYQNGADFLEALRNLRLEQQRFEGGVATVSLPRPQNLPSEPAPEAEETPSPSTDPPAPVRRWIVVSGIVLVLASFGLGWLLRGGSRTEPPLRTAAVTPIPSVAEPVELFEPAGPPAPPVLLDDEPLPAAEPPKPKPEKKKKKKKSPRPAPKPEPKPEVAPAPVPEPVAVALADAPTKPAPAEPPAPEPVQVPVAIKSSVKDGLLTLLVNGEPVYSSALAIERKKWGKLKRAVGKGQQELETSIALPAGTHEIAAQLEVTGKTRLHEQILTVQVAPDDDRTLRVVAGRTIGRRLTLNFD